MMMSLRGPAKPGGILRAATNPYAKWIMYTGSGTVRNSLIGIRDEDPSMVVTDFWIPYSSVRTGRS